jgi:uncharacterized membrane protein
VADQQTDVYTSFEDYPLTRNEYIAAMVHFYRGERSRADAWRSRLDPTTNWAVATTAGMLSFAFGDPYHSHVALLLANVLVLVFLFFEARRFRYFDVWRSRVRMIEENFFIPIIRRNLVSPRTDWREFVAEDLNEPKFKITMLQALALRLRCNYIWIYLVIFAAWWTKVAVQPTAAGTFGEVVQRMAIGPIPGLVVLVVLTVFYGVAGWLAVWAGGQKGGTDEVHGVEKAIEHWKT